MNLVIDIGNTRIKAAVFRKKELLHFFVYDSANEFLDAGLIKKNNIRNCILSSVVKEIDPLIENLKSQVPVLLFSSDSASPVKNIYRSPSTLGSDRLAAAVGANAAARNENVLVIDAGTCIKYNFINSENEYLGGGISPGLQMRYKALNSFTSRLPLLSPNEQFDQLIGTDSEGSIRSGVQTGAIAEVEGLIEMYNERFNNIKVFLTGGDTDFFAKRLKKRIFADPFLILKGLNEILEYNT